MIRRPLAAGAIALFLLGAQHAGLSAEKSEKVDGYAEYRDDSMLIVDGQRVRVGPATRQKLKGVAAGAAIPLGFEVEVKGIRLRDGSILASELEAKPNGTALFEEDVRKATDELEAIWLRSGEMFEPTEDGGRNVIGPTLASGPKVERVRRIMGRLAPPYVDPAGLRAYVIDTDEWNAAAMGNGAIWVYSGLLAEMNDDEVAVVLGHELAHYTHEHSRRNAKKAMWGQLLAATAAIASEAIDNRTARDVTAVAALLSLTAWQSGYSRDLEDQADRVGLRYAYEGGFDVAVGPRLWGRFRDKYGEGDAVTTFFFGGHSRPSDRIRNLERELALNYAPAPILP